ncbi:dethiobiotin synthase [Acinetobacter nectaris]|uniref:dethiobiotin synthase n=1 Tax=Acinetobacter nectaris TaxID=1219382 RepID=UPI001F022E49|nr:dethiobiotin synthase [Acinetobacter nectaris]MCF8998856.1 ATP-dependent dethiobiotin synthetase BioD [Acinetobacter nectaris]MCF9027903.1 ATP-dependent dethiobiotin synthetase BioD [Acinetobacter nectaris]
MSHKVYFISGIDTEVGKTYATGYLARRYLEAGQSVITQKLIQTGNEAYSEDILKHREIMGVPLFEEDHQKITMPEIFSYPASPHLSAKLDRRPINFNKIAKATQQLTENFELVLLEGAGGLMVPLTDDLLTIDYIQQHEFPVILVTSGRLGSINHTLLSLEALKSRNINLHAIAYNLNDESEDQTISIETQRYLKEYVQKQFPTSLWFDIPKI